jgi:hypothetical protein
MRPTPRPPARLKAALALALMTLCLGVLLVLLWPIHRIVLQAVALAAIFIGLGLCPPFAGWVARMPLAHRAVFFLLVLSVVAGHFSLDKRTYYPFVAWGIFSAVSEKDPVLCRELVGTTAHGKSVRLLVEQLFPSIVQFDLPPADQTKEMDDLVQALARVYNQIHPSEPVRQVDLMLLAVQLTPSSSEPRHQPSCELLQRYDISSGL